jgi:HSP20 family protein
MTMMRRPTALPEVVTLRDAMDRLFDDRFFRPSWTWPVEPEADIVPPFDLYTTPDAVIAKVALPGVQPEKVDISIADGVVTISGSFEETTETTEAGYVHKELRHGTFRRVFPLPAAVKTDQAKASFKDGMLVLTLPKTEELKPTHIKVETT